MDRGIRPRRDADLGHVLDCGQGGRRAILGAMNVRLLPDYRHTLSVAHRWIIVSLGIVLGLLASACVDMRTTSGDLAQAASSHPVVAVVQEYRS